MISITKIKSVKEFEEFINTEGKLNIVKFSAPWCGPCRVLSAFIYSTVDTFYEGMQFAEVNTDDFEDLCEKYNITNLPTMVYYKAGEVVYKTMGLFSSRDEYIKLLADIRDGNVTYVEETESGNTETNILESGETETTVEETTTDDTTTTDEVEDNNDTSDGVA
jgi:thioredoxin 1